LHARNSWFYGSNVCSVGYAYGSIVTLIAYQTRSSCRLMELGAVSVPSVLLYNVLLIVECIQDAAICSGWVSYISSAAGFYSKKLDIV
jgi:hypothetical protein